MRYILLRALLLSVALTASMSLAADPQSPIVQKLPDPLGEWVDTVLYALIPEDLD